jgi:acyl-CoA synthetase (AMP-forming)/AMP-acid ligase II
MSESPAFNVLQPILAASARHPDRRALATLDESITYGQLRALVESCARHMQRHGIDRRARVALAGDHPLIMTTLAFACAMVGCAWVRFPASPVAHAMLRLTHCLYVGPRAPAGKMTMIEVGADWTRPPPGAPARPFEFHRSARDTWMISHSSGTTGVPKFMALAAGSIWQRRMDELLALEGETPVFVSLFPILSTLNLPPAMQVLSMGGTVAFAELADLYGGLHVDGVLGSPNQYIEFMNETAPEGSPIPTCIVTGAMIGPEFVRRLAPYARTIKYLYGSTEAGALCSTLIDPADGESGGFAVGRPHTGVEVEILADDDSRLPAGQEGRVRVRSPAMVSGYLGDPALSEGIFQDGWFHPGDVGHLSADGTLRITGRISELMNIGGVKRNPAILDEAIRACPGVMDGACFAEPGPDGIDQVAAAIRLNGPLDVDVLKQAVAEAVARRSGPDTVPRRIYLVNEIPRNASGKTQRHLLPDAVRGATVVAIERDS